MTQIKNRAPPPVNDSFARLFLLASKLFSHALEMNFVPRTCRKFSEVEFYFFYFPAQRLLHPDSYPILYFAYMPLLAKLLIYHFLLFLLSISQVSRQSV